MVLPTDIPPPYPCSGGGGGGLARRVVKGLSGAPQKKQHPRPGYRPLKNHKATLPIELYAPLEAVFADGGAAAV